MTVTDPEAGPVSRRGNDFAPVDRIRFGRASVFTAELFTHAEVAAIRTAALCAPPRLRHEVWFAPGSSSMATIGEPLYRNRDRFEHYARTARAENRLLYRHFRLAHERVAAFFERRYGIPVTYAEDLAVPGFHVFSFALPSRFEGGGWHVDGLHTQVPFFAAHRDEVEAVVNFTVPFDVPDGGSGLDLEDDLPDSPGRGGGAAVTVPYVPGVMVFTEAEHFHRLAASYCETPMQRRITLQGHGVRFRGQWLLFW